MDTSNTPVTRKHDHFYGYRFGIIAVACLMMIMLPMLSQAQDYDEEYTLDRNYPISAGGTIHLKSNDADVQITGSDRDSVHVYVVYRANFKGITLDKDFSFRMNVESKGGNLYVSESPDNTSSMVLGIGVLDQEYSIIIEAPRSAGLNIDGDDDNYQLSHINGDIKLEADDGDIVLRDCKGDHFEFDIEDGNLQLSGGKGFLKFETEDGAVQVANGKFKEIRGKSEDGDVKVATDLISDGVYRFEMEDGDLDFTALSGGGTVTIDRDDGDISNSGSVKQLSKEEHHAVYRIPGGEGVVDISIEDGDIHLLKSL